MSWVTDIKDILEKLKFAEIVDEGQVGIHLRKGKTVYHEKRYFGKELEEIVQEERNVINSNGGRINFLISPRQVKLPSGYGRKWASRLPRHPKRYIKDKNLSPGFYWCIPFIDSIYTDHNQERRIISKAEDMPVVPIVDGGNVALGFMMVQKISDYYIAYTCGDDYEDLLRGQASKIIAKLASGKTKKEWTNPSLYGEIADTALEKLQAYTAMKWGVSVSELALTQIMINPALLIGYGMNAQTSSYIGGTVGPSNTPINR